MGWPHERGVHGIAPWEGRFTLAPVSESPSETAPWLQVQGERTAVVTQRTAAGFQAPGQAGKDLRGGGQGGEDSLAQMQPCTQRHDCYLQPRPPWGFHDLPITQALSIPNEVRDLRDEVRELGVRSPPQIRSPIHLVLLLGVLRPQHGCTGWGRDSLQSWREEGPGG